MEKTKPSAPKVGEESKTRESISSSKLNPFSANMLDLMTKVKK
jgi:hypothetical protein